MSASAFVVIHPASQALAAEPILGVPLAFWGIRALRTILPLESIAVAGASDATNALAKRLGISTVAAPSPSASFYFDSLRPFCAPATIMAAQQRSVAHIPDAQISAIERTIVSDHESLELARALARGLAPDHPAIAGVTRLRLPLTTDIRAIISDVDGCLTDGGISYHSAPDAGRTFNTHDGYAHMMLAQAGIKVGWLSATSSTASIERRAAQLKVPAIDAGPGDKGPRFLALCEKLGVTPAQTIYLGDDLNDLPAMRHAAATACPSDAPAAIRNTVDITLSAAGGGGAFRELADIVLAGITPQNPR